MGARVFELSQLDCTTGLTMNGFHLGGCAGYSVSSAGDVNMDGINDLIVGDPGFGSGMGVYPGRVYIIFGNKNFPNPFDLLVE
jgi:FG-GAP repeat